MTAGQQAPERPSSGAVIVGANWRDGRVGFWASVALLSSALAWTLHHTAFFARHEIVTAIVAVLIASAVAVLAVVAAANRRHAQPPLVLVAASDDVAVRGGRGADLPFCSALHAQALAHGFFVGLGPTFLRAYYESFLSSPHARFHVATVKGHPAGMLVGIVHPRAHLRWLLRRRGAVLGLLACGAMFTRPLVTVRFLRTRVRRYRQTWRRHRGGGDPGGSETILEAVLSHVAVLPGARGAGIGQRLVDAFLADAEREGRERVMLTTLAGDGGARGFYLANGWSDAGQRASADGRTMIAMDFDLRR